MVVNEVEAQRVRAIFRLFLEQGTLVSTVRELERRGWRNKRWMNRQGQETGGAPFGKGTLHILLTNPLYLGKMTYKGELHPGEHRAIVEPGVFEKAQVLLKKNGLGGGAHVRNKHGALLRGILRCASCDCAMIHAWTPRGENKRYRYYVCLNAQKRGWQACPTKSVSAPEMERHVIDQIRSIGKDRKLLEAALKQAKVLKQKNIEELEAESRVLGKEMARLNVEIHQAAVGAGNNAKAAAKLADLQDRLRMAERRATEVREEIIGLERNAVGEKHLASAFTIFDPVWETLSPREHARILYLLVERVAYNGEKKTVSITFRSTGIKALAGQLATADGRE